MRDIVDKLLILAVFMYVSYFSLSSLKSLNTCVIKVYLALSLFHWTDCIVYCQGKDVKFMGPISIDLIILCITRV